MDGTKPIGRRTTIRREKIGARSRFQRTEAAFLREREEESTEIRQMPNSFSDNSTKVLVSNFGPNSGFPHAWIQVISGKLQIGQANLEQADGLAIEEMDQTIGLSALEDSSFFVFRLPLGKSDARPTRFVSAKKQAFDLPDAEIEYFPSLFSVARADSLLESLIDQVQWTQNTIRFYGKESLVPRLEAWYGDAGASYSYSGIRMEPRPWIEELSEIKKAIEPIAGTPVQFRSDQLLPGWTGPRCMAQ